MDLGNASTDSSKNPDDFQRAFSQAARTIKEKAGNPQTLKLEEIHYLIDESSWSKNLGVLKFDIVIVLSGESGRVYVQQPGCGLAKRGIVFASPVKILPSIPNYYL